jgi:4-amino-4-deoxy-L-arabinose transferase-like glycosyltransferase
MLPEVRHGLVRRLERACRSPLAWVLATVFMLHAIGLGWGLPASDGWDNDGVAPRDFLAGLVETVTPGSFFQYPPVHLALLGVLTSPVTLVALARAHSLAQADVVREILKVPYMTAIAVIARLVSVVMSIGIAWAIAKIAEELRGPRAGWCAAAFLGVSAPLTYYAHTSNLDVPYLFWGSLALLGFTRAVRRGEPKLLRPSAALAALAVATKDQAYALFLLSAPIAVLAWVLASRPPERRAILREAAISSALCAAIVLVVDGALYNASGFAMRVRFLLGPASQDYAQYTSDAVGRAEAAWDIIAGLLRFGPWPLWGIAAAGLVFELSSTLGRGRERVAALLPLLVAASFLVSFNCVARRTDERFGLPEATALAVYGGVGLDVLLGLRAPGKVVAAACLAWAFWLAAAVDANLLFDPRYDAEAWLRSRVRPEDTVETYGLNVYMPRFPSDCRVTRVGPLPGDHRSPMPGVEELTEAYDRVEARGPRFLVLSEGWAWRYLLHEQDFPVRGRVLAAVQRRTAEDARSTAYFQALVEGRLPSYRLVHTSAFASRFWPRVDLHASTGRRILVYERTGSRPR